MFYYISFLRPPPLQASAIPTEPILITPQISNDLRTEFLDDPINIYYAWSLYRAPHPGTSPVITKPTKLTSWRTSTAYKEIPVPNPLRLDAQHQRKDATDGSDAWRLILTCGTSPDDPFVVLGEETDTTGTAPLAVMSMPVTFSRRHGQTGHSKNAARSAKQERIARSYALRVPTQDDRSIVFDITEQTSFDLDKKIWDSGIGLGSWLARLFSGKGADTTQLSGLRESLFSTEARHILELGAGTGIVAITLATLRSTLDLSDRPGSIITTDLASAIPILQDNINSNHPLVSKCIPQAVVLDWENEQLPPQVQDQLETGLDVIVMADVTYNTASFSALIGTLSRLIQLCKMKGKRCSPRVLMGYKERHPDERTLWDHAKDIGLHFQHIAHINGAGGNPVEIWLG